MRFLPDSDATDPATKSDIDDLKADFSELKGDIRHLSQRIDRLYQGMVGGFAAIVASLIAGGFFV